MPGCATRPPSETVYHRAGDAPRVHTALDLRTWLTASVACALLLLAAFGQGHEAARPLEVVETASGGKRRDVDDTPVVFLHGIADSSTSD
eukprot:2173948-Prymnesium_polylepis.1